jgi:hypothetical protein
LFHGILDVLILWSLSNEHSSSESSSNSQQLIQPLVDEMVNPMQYSVDPTLLLGGDAYFDHVVSYHVQPLVEEVVVLMQSFTDTTLLLESNKSKKVTSSMQSLVNPTLLLGSDTFVDYIFSIYSSVPSERWGIPLSLSMFPPSLGMVSFDWNDLLEPVLPSSTPFQIMVKVNSTRIFHCIVDEGASTSILSSLTWQDLGSPNLVLATGELLDFNIISTEVLGILPQFPITLGRNIVLVDLLVVPGPLYFNMILGRDYVYVMNVMVSTLFRVMYFPHNRSIVTIDQLSSDNHHPGSALDQVSPLYVPSVRVDSSMPRVNYVVSYPRCSIVFEKGYLQSCFPSRDKVSTIDHVFYPMGA